MAMRTKGMMGLAGATLALLVVLLLGAGMAESKPRHRGCHEHGANARFDRLEEKLAALELDDQTRASAEQVLARARAESESQREAKREARRVLRELLDQEQPVVEQVMAQADALGALETEAHKAKLRTKLELRALLGPDQWQELRDAFRKNRHGRHERMEKS
jgi:Spy/CpxP family protein refolding chaperone